MKFKNPPVADRWFCHGRILSCCNKSIMRSNENSREE